MRNFLHSVFNSMKKIIFFNTLITLAWVPYSMQRWLRMPYSEGIWTLETLIVFGAFFIGAGLAISNLLLLFSFRSKRYQLLFLKITMLLLAGLFVFPIYAGIVVGYEGHAVWVDILAIGILYGNLWLSNKVYQSNY